MDYYGGRTSTSLQDLAEARRRVEQIKRLDYKSKGVRKERRRLLQYIRYWARLSMYRSRF
jgi:hypothetical protein